MRTEQLTFPLRTNQYVPKRTIVSRETVGLFPLFISSRSSFLQKRSWGDGMGSKFQFGGLEAARSSGGGGESSGGIYCDICHCALTSLSDVKTLPCLHNFCLRCVPQKQGCPICLPIGATAISSLPQPSSVSTSSSAFASLSGLNPQQLTSPLTIDTSLLIGNLLDSVSLRDDSSYPSHTTSLPQGNGNSFFGNISSGPPGNAFGGFPLSGNRLGPVGGAGRSAFPTSHSSSLLSPSSGPPCQNCSEGVDSNARCEDCHEFLCENCVQAHYRVRMTRDHRVVPLIQTQSGSSGHSPLSPNTAISATNGSCPAHREPLWLLCETCSRPLCRRCLGDHPGHSFGYLHKANDTVLTAQLLSDARQLERCLEECSEGVERMGERVEARVVAISNEIRAVLLHHISVLEERKRDLLQRVDTIRQAKIQSLSVQREQLRTRLVTLKSALEKADSLLHRGGGSVGDMASRNAKELLLAQLQAVRPYMGPQEIDSISFTSPDPALLIAIKNLGAIQTSAHAPKSMIVGESFRRIVTERVAYFTLQAKDPLGEPCLIGGDPVSVLVTTPGNGSCPAEIQDRQNGTYLVSYKPSIDGEHVIEVRIRGAHITGSPFRVFARKGRDYGTIGNQPLFSFGGEGTGDGQLCRPWGIAVEKEGRLVVVDRSNNRIQVFDKDGEFLYKFGTSGGRPGQFDRPAGVAVNSRNQLIIADKDNHRIQVFQIDGTFEYKFGDKGRGVGQFNYPWAVSTNSEDQIAVSDTRNHRVQLFSSSGGFLKKFGFDNSLFYKHFDSPRGVCFLPDGQLIVSDFNNHRLAVISIASGEMKFYGREGDWEGAYKRPQGLDVDLEGYVIVADSRNNRVQVLNPELRFIASFGWEGRGAALMDRPCDVCIHPEGRIFVVDFGNNKIHVF